MKTKNIEIRIINKDRLIASQYWVEDFTLHEVSLIEKLLRVDPNLREAVIFIGKDVLELNLDIIKVIKAINFESRV